jgi:4-amino-4-deoxy-L-arabinose transferase-like glycosyltransferase
MDIAWVALLLIAVFLYLYGLGGSYAPTNGDEMVYIHIARLTAQSGHWLPLLSDIANLRNTKPPLLFWQAMVAGEWGQHWSLLALRLPSIVYTFLTTALLALLTHRISGKWRTAALAAVLYLAFFSSFRYGRVYLTSAPETFWLALPVFWLVWHRLRGQGLLAPDTRPIGFGTYALFGLSMGLGLAYKSFALIAPAAATLWCAILITEPRLRWGVAVRTTVGVALSTAIALGIFALWFALDPDPAAVWAEFVVGENAGKMAGQGGYWHSALFGDYPMWTQLLAYPENAGLLAFAVFGVGWVGMRQLFSGLGRFKATPQLLVLLVWLVVWLVVFAIPSQRSARYVIPAMPALAMVMALYWERIARPWFWATLVLTVPAFVLLGRIGWVIASMDIGSAPALALCLLFAGAGLLAVVLGLLKPDWARNCALVACLMVYGTFSAMVAPLGSPQAQYSSAVQAQLPTGARVAVPNGFTGQYERFQFVLPGKQIVPFDAEGRNTGALKPELPPVQRLAFLLGGHDAVVWLQDDLQETQPSCVPQCKVLGTRWHVKSRHKAGEVTLANLWYPQQWLFRREWLVVNAAP